MKYLIVLAAVVLASCSGGETLPASPSALAPFEGDGSARVSTLSVKDNPLANSCDVSSFRTHQGNGPAGFTKQTMEMRPGPGLAHWDVEFSRRNNQPGKPNDYVGAVVRRASDSVPIIEILINENGVWRTRMKGRLCSQWSAYEEFTVGGYPEPGAWSLEPEPVEEQDCYLGAELFGRCQIDE